MKQQTNAKLPKGWTATFLSEIAETASGGTPSRRRKDFFGGSIPWVKSGELNDATLHTTEEFLTDPGLQSSSAKMFPEGTLCIALYGATVGKLAILGSEAATNQAICGILVHPLVDTQYLFYFLLGQRRNLIELGKGGAQPNISQEIIRRIVVPLPPLKEQTRIVSKIDELLTKLDAGVEELCKAQAQLKRYRQVVLKSAVTGELTREWREAHNDQLEPASELLARILKERRERWESNQLAKLAADSRTSENDTWKLKYDEPLSPDATALPQLPHGWTWVTMPQLGELNRGKSKHRPRNAPHLYNGDYPFIQTGDIRRASGLLRQYKQTYSEAGLKQSRLWPKGTLCITIAANIAETAILGFDACFPDSVVGFRAEPDSCDVRFVDFFIRTAKQNLERYAPATAQKNINIEILSDVAIPFPPILEQRQIADEVERILSITDASEQIIEARLKQAERLRQSILKQAFEGRLVPQDLNDEPAELLLERIKIERAKREAEKQAEAKSNRKRFTRKRPNRTERPAA